MVQAEFALEPGLVTLVKFSSGNKPPVKGIIDVPMKLKDLIKEMRHQGVDIFPDCDSHCYIEVDIRAGEQPSRSFTITEKAPTRVSSMVSRSESGTPAQR